MKTKKKKGGGEQQPVTSKTEGRDKDRVQKKRKYAKVQCKRDCKR